MAEKTAVVKAPKGHPAHGASKTTVNRIIPVTITPVAREYTVVLDPTGAPRATYPILSFDVTGPPGWLYEVQVAHSDLPFTESPGLKWSWAGDKNPDHRWRDLTFSSWSNGEKGLKLDGDGKARYTMPLEWWKDQARQYIEDFQDDEYIYRAVGFEDSSGAKARFSTPNGKHPPTVTLHNNLVDFVQTVDQDMDSYYYTGDGAHAYKKVSNRIKVRARDTWDMYCLVQWFRGRAATKSFDGTVDSRFPRYGFITRGLVSELSVDRSMEMDPRYHSNVANAHDHTSATFDDIPGFPNIWNGTNRGFYRADFRTMVHLNCDLAGKKVLIKKMTGQPPVYDEVIGVLPDPQPALLAAIDWKVRIFFYRYPTHLEVSHPDGDIDDPAMPDPLL
jgi:hypothetical protein